MELKGKKIDYRKCGKSFIFTKKYCSECRRTFQFQKIPYKMFGIEPNTKKVFICPNGCKEYTGNDSELI